MAGDRDSGSGDDSGIGTDTTAGSIEDRIERIEARQDIGQLPIRYAMAVDQRDMDTWVGLFVPDVRAGRFGNGREALKQFISPQVEQFYRSIHFIMGHRIVLDDRDSAHGHVYCRAEHEVGGRWVVMAIRYDDTYRRVDGEWLFATRRERHWYAVDAVDTPQSVQFDSWKTSPHPPTVPRVDPTTWSGFWTGVDTSEITSAPIVD